MKVFDRPVLIAGIIFLVLLAACTPGTTPVPVSIPPADPPKTTLPTSNINPSTAQDTAWAKIVAAARQEGKLTIYSFNFVGDIGLAISKAFKDEYNITVDIITGRGAEFAERLKTEKRLGRIVCDLTEGNATNLTNMKIEGLTVSVADDIPVLREKDVWIADILSMDPKDKHIIVWNFTVYSPYINTNVVKPGDEPKVWRDLLDPKWKGKMVLTDYVTSAGPYQVFVPLLREKVIDEEFLKALYKQDLRFSSALPDEAGLLARGERSISIRGSSGTYGRFIAEGAPIRAIPLSDGLVLSVITITAIKEAPHPNAAKVFINWFMSPQGQTVYGKIASAASARKDVPSFLHKNAQVIPQRSVMLTNEYVDEATKLFRERYLEKLWAK